MNGLILKYKLKESNLHLYCVEMDVKFDHRILVCGLESRKTEFTHSSRNFNFGGFQNIWGSNLRYLLTFKDDFLNYIYWSLSVERKTRRTNTNEVISHTLLDIFRLFAPLYYDYFPRTGAMSGNLAGTKPPSISSGPGNH